MNAVRGRVHAEQRRQAANLGLPNLCGRRVWADHAKNRGFDPGNDSDVLTSFENCAVSVSIAMMSSHLVIDQ